MICIQCDHNKSIQKFRPRASYKTKDGLKERARSKVCTTCEYINWKTRGRCPRCKKPADGICQYCSKRRSERQQRCKNDVLNHYGHQCSWCTEDKSLFLTIDHIDNSGSAVRKLGSYGRWKQIITNDYPDNLRLLCFNCNSGRSTYGDEAILISLNDLHFVPVPINSDQSRNVRNKSLVLQHYGEQCDICSEERFVFLTIDHLNGDGHSHRKKIGNSVSRWLVKNNYPNGFRTLCWNCNTTVAIHGEDVVRKTLMV